MLNVTDRDGSLKALVKINTTGLPVKMYVASSTANGQAINIPVGATSFSIINRGVNGATTSYEDYTISDGDSYIETIESTELTVSRDAGFNRYFDQKFVITPGTNSQLKVIYIM